MIFILDRNENVINILRNSEGGSTLPPFFDDILTEDLSTGGETFSFSTIAKGSLATDLSVGNYVAFKKNNKYKLFQIMEVEETHQQEMLIEVYCESAGLELINKVFRKRSLKGVNLKKFLSTILDETGWSVGLISAIADKELDIDLDDSSVYSILQNNLPNFDVELEFRVDIVNGKIAAKYVDTYPSRGRVTGKRFTFGKDIEGIKRKSSGTELYTALIGKGKNGIDFKDIVIDGIDKPAGQDFVADQESYNRYNHSGYHVMGLFEYDTDDARELLRETYKKLQEVKEVKVEYEVSIALLSSLLGETWNNVNIGDTVTIVDHQFNPPIQLGARVSKLETSFTDPEKDSCTLANFVELKSNITDDMRKIAAQLEGYVDGAISDKFPISGNDIQEGAITGGHIYKDSITTEHLNADLITAVTGRFESIEAETAKIGSLETEVAKIGQLEVNVAEIDKAVINKADIEQLEVTQAKVQNLEAETAKISDLEVNLAKIDKGYVNELFVNNLVGQHGKFQSAHIGTLTSDNIDTNTINAEHIAASVIEAINMSVSGKITADKIDVNSLVVDNIDAGKITTGTLDANRITSSVISAINASIENATINSAKIGNIDASKITTGSLAAEVIKTNVISAINASIGKISADHIDVDNIKVGNIDADQITSGNIDTDRLQANVIAAINSYAGTMKIQQGQIENLKVGNANIIDLDASKITSGKIDANYIDVDSIKIKDANIESLNASKISGGTLDAKDITVTNLNADSITVGQINGRQIASGSIDYDKLDSVLSGDIRNTIDNVDQALEDVGLVQETVKKTIRSVDVEYAQSTSSTVAPTSGWQTNPPTWTNGSFIWSRTTTVLTNGTSTTTKPVCITGAKGDTGDTGAKGDKGDAGNVGQGVDSITEEYYLSTSNTTQTNGSWVTTPPTWSVGKYMWTRSKIVYKNPASTVYTTPICDSSWEAINSIKIGGRNFLLNTGMKKDASKLVLSPGVSRDTSKLTPNGNPSAYINISGLSANSWRCIMQDYKGFEVGKEYVFSASILVPTGHSIDEGAAIEIIGEDSTGTRTFTKRASIDTSIIDNWKTYVCKITVPNNTIKLRCWVYVVRNGRMYVGDLKLEEGNKETTWTPAPEDVTEEISTVTSIANGKNSVYYSASAPSTSGKKENDIWFDTDDGHKMYKFSNGSWVATQFGTNAIVSNAITADKIASSSIIAGKIATGAVTTDKLYALSVTSDKVAANSITAGKIATDAVLANNIKAGAVTTDKISSKAINADKLDVDNLFVGNNAFINKLKAVEIDASNITTGKISNERIDLTGFISFEAFDDNIKGIMTPPYETNADGTPKLDANGNKIPTKTFINGGSILTNSVTADKIDIKGLTVIGPDNRPTFSVTKDGEVVVDAMLKSDNFDATKNTGYQVTTDGKAIFNEAEIRGDVKLPNAGMTNYGATIGNENILKNSNFNGNLDYWYTHDMNSGGTNKLLEARTGGDWIPPNTYALQIRGTNTVERYGVGQSFILKPNTKYTISGYCACHRTGNLRITVRNEENSSAHIHHYVPPNSIGGNDFSKWHRIETTFTTQSATKYSMNLYTENFQDNGYAWFGNIKLEEGEKATPWCPNPDEQINYTRFWAGTSFENRDNAPFRVMQNGDLVANRGTFGGTVVSDEVNVGNIHLHENQIVLNSVTKTLSDDGEVYSIAPLHANDNPYVNINSSYSLFNNNVYFGSVGNKKIEFINSDNKINFNQTTFQWNSNSNGQSNILFNPNSGELCGLNIIGATGGRQVMRHSTSDDRLGTLIFDSQGNQGVRGDFSFTRKNYTQDVKVDIDGELQIKTKIKGKTNNMEMRTTSTGFAFYAT